MLYEFINSNRSELAARCSTKVARRFPPGDAHAAVNLDVSTFLVQLVNILRNEEITAAGVGVLAPASTDSRVGNAAALHGSQMLEHGFSAGEVVHGYGDVCQSITELAIEKKALISADEFRTLNGSLDDAIADAVTAFSSAHQVTIDRGTDDFQTRLNQFSDEHRRLVDIAIQSFAAMRTGTIGLTGATGTLLTHALDELRTLADRTLPATPPTDPKSTQAAT